MIMYCKSIFCNVHALHRLEIERVTLLRTFIRLKKGKLLKKKKKKAAINTILLGVVCWSWAPPAAPTCGRSGNDCQSQIPGRRIEKVKKFFLTNHELISAFWVYGNSL